MLKTIIRKIKAALEMLWTVFSSVAIIGGLLGILYFVGGREAMSWISAMRWQETTCQVHGAKLNSNRDIDGDSSYSISTSYSFIDEADKHFGNRYDFSIGEGSSSRGPSARAVRYLKNNPSVPCYFNPNNPEESVIDRSFHWNFLFMIIPLVLLGLFGTMAMGGLIGLVRGRKQQAPRYKQKMF